jgi:hypothetical protein
MDKTAVGTCCKAFYTQFFQFCMLDGDRRQFSRSDKGEIARIEAEDDPLSFVIR